MEDTGVVGQDTLVGRMEDTGVVGQDTLVVGWRTQVWSDRTLLWTGIAIIIKIK